VTNNQRAINSFAVMALLLVMVGITQSWNVSLAILNLCLISAVMSLGLNIQWGYAGLFNAGVMASTALGGLAAVLVSHSSVGEAWAVGGEDAGLAIITLSITVLGAWWIRSTIPKGSTRAILFAIWLLGGYALLRYFYEQASLNIEAVDPARTGFLGGLGLPILFSWLVGGLAAAGLAWIVGRVALGLRSDYFAIATLGISEIMISILKNEDWLTRGVKNVTGLERPVPYEIDLQQSEWFIDLVIRLHSPDLSQVGEEALGEMVMLASGVFVKLCYSALFLAVLLIILGLAALALNSPWGRMMRAIRDNEIAAAAMGKDVTSRHRQVFILGSAVIGVAGAMLTTLDGQFTPGTYIPLRFTFLIWVMVIVGGSGNNLGAVLGAFITWFTWIEAEPVALWAVEILNSFLSEENPLRQHFIDVSPHLRMVVMGLILILVLRFRPEGILPEKNTSRT
jgi:branched-chain amino acid transport system permease protein